MKKHLVFKALILVFAIAIFNSCSKDGATGATGPQGPAGPSYTGSISGHVFLYNQYGDQQPLTSSQKVRVLLYNSSNTTGTGTVGLVDSVNADAQGVYTISNIATGLYTLAFRDSGYGQDEHENFQFLGSTQPLEVDAKLSQTPNFTFTIGGDSVHNRANDTLVYIYGTLPIAASQTTYLAVFIGGSANVSSTPGTYSSVSSFTIGAGATTFNSSIAVNSFYLAGLTPGQPAYIAVYAASTYYASTSEYENYSSGQTTYNALGMSLTANPIPKL